MARIVQGQKNQNSVRVPEAFAKRPKEIGEL
jgi:hypothetical protein